MGKVEEEEEGGEKLTSVKYPTAYSALANPISALFKAQRYASVSLWGNTPVLPTRYQAVKAKHASR